MCGILVFLPGSSTITQLHELYKNHALLCSEDKYKLLKMVHWWFEDYLKDRVQRVIINSSFSSWKHVPIGVLQESVLGPFLFLVFITDITSVVSVIQDFLYTMLISLLKLKIENKLH